MVLYWLLRNGNCRWPKNSCKERRQLVRSGNGPNAGHHHREKHTMSLMKMTNISSPGHITDLAFLPPRPEATFPSKSHSGILAPLILSLVFGYLIASSPRLTLFTAARTASTFRPQIPVPPTGGLATQIPAHRSGQAGPDRTTMLHPHNLLLFLSFLAILCAPQRQRDSSHATTRAGTLSRPPFQQFLTQHALYVRLL